MPKLDFLVSRLLRMSLPELLYRVGQKVQNTVERRCMDSYRFHWPVTEDNRRLFSRELEFVRPEEIVSRADKLMEHRFDIFRLKDFYIGPEIDYHRDYKHGVNAPTDVFGKSIDYRDSSRIGDIKYIWELNRHLFLLPLALAFSVTGERKYIEKFKYFLKAWLAQNPFMKGVNWSSSLELGIRLINWTLCWHILHRELDEDFKTRWLDSVYRHCWFISRNLSAYSSANNHLIGEAAGLFMSSTAMPQCRNSERWREKSFKILVEECRKQNYGDGVNKEQAISYQQFVLDFLLLCGLTGEANDKKFPGDYWFMVERMLVYIASTENFGGNLPQFGDEDDGYVVDMLQREYGAYRSLLNTGAHLFKRSKFLKSQGEMDQKTLLLLNIGKIHREDVKFTETGLPVCFNEGGYYLLGSGFHTEKEQKMVFDCGSLGYLSIAAHGHADALSFYFSAGGCPVFVDPGTYAYHADRRWRNYFRGTSAHNTVRIDGQDQSVMAGNFMWSKKARARMETYETLTRVKGRHDGYMRLGDPTIHEREVIYSGTDDVWEIRDRLRCRGSHTAEIFFHVHPQCRVEKSGGQVRIYFARGYCQLESVSGLEVEVYVGEEDKPLGWYSPAYDVKVPAATIRYAGNISGTTTVITRFGVVFYG